ncbi:DNA-binding response regulator [Yersinia enterocolitica]|nr:DNA-binding response regulator [Yersinia enterocolitica]
MLNISIMNSNGYLRRGVYEVIKEILEGIKVSYRIGITATPYKDSHVLFIDASQMSGNFELKINQLKNEFIDLFVVLPYKNYVLSHDQLMYKKINTITCICLDDTLFFLRKKIMSELKYIIINKKAKRKPTQKKCMGFTLNKSLTKEECVIMQYFKEGFTGGYIANILNKSEKTVSCQKRSAMKKMGVRNNIELIHKILSMHCIN